MSPSSYAVKKPPPSSPPLCHSKQRFRSARCFSLVHWRPFCLIPLALPCVACLPPVLAGQPFRWKYFDAPPSVRQPDGHFPGGGPNTIGGGNTPERRPASAWASHTCHPGAAATQLRCAQSLLQHVVAPLEARGNTVTLFLAPTLPAPAPSSQQQQRQQQKQTQQAPNEEREEDDEGEDRRRSGPAVGGEPCGLLLAELVEALGAHRVATVRGEACTGQADSVAHAARTFLDWRHDRPLLPSTAGDGSDGSDGDGARSGEAGVGDSGALPVPPPLPPPSAYDLVVLARFDLFWRVPVDQWRTPNLAKGVHVLSRCMGGAPPAKCDTDAVHFAAGPFLQRALRHRARGVLRRQRPKWRRPEAPGCPARLERPRSTRQGPRLLRRPPARRGGPQGEARHARVGAAPRGRPRGLLQRLR